MSLFPKSLLLDTNIWLDNYISERPLSGISQSLIDFANSHNIALLYAIPSLKDTYYGVTMFLKRAARIDGKNIDAGMADAINKMAFASVKNMSELATAVGVDASDVWLALKLFNLHSDVEDDLILAAMERSEASFLVTNDAQLVRHAKCAVMTAQDMLDYLECLES